MDEKVTELKKLALELQELEEKLGPEAKAELYAELTATMKKLNEEIEAFKAEYQQ